MVESCCSEAGLHARPPLARDENERVLKLIVQRVMNCSTN